MQAQQQNEIINSDIRIDIQQTLLTNLKEQKKKVREQQQQIDRQQLNLNSKKSIKSVQNNMQIDYKRKELQIQQQKSFIMNDYRLSKTCFEQDSYKLHIFKDDFRVEDEEKKNMQRQHIILQEQIQKIKKQIMSKNEQKKQQQHSVPDINIIQPDSKEQ